MGNSSGSFARVAYLVIIALSPLFLSLLFHASSSPVVEETHSPLYPPNSPSQAPFLLTSYFFFLLLPTPPPPPFPPRLPTFLPTPIPPLNLNHIPPTQRQQTPPKLPHTRIAHPATLSLLLPRTSTPKPTCTSRTHSLPLPLPLPPPSRLPRQPPLHAPHPISTVSAEALQHHPVLSRSHPAALLQPCGFLADAAADLEGDALRLKGSTGSGGGDGV